MVRPISGVIFDLDGTLYHLSRTRARLTLRLWRSLPHLRHLGAARRAIRGRVFESEQELKRAFSDELAARARTTPESAARWYDHEFMGHFIDLLENDALCRPGLIPLLSRLRAAGIKLAVLSDIGLVEERLRAIGIPPEAFDALLCAEASGELKPSPRSLLSIAERWAHPPGEILMVGDRPDRDGEAADAAGMDSIIIDNRSPFFRRRRKKGLNAVPWNVAMATIEKRAGLE